MMSMGNVAIVNVARKHKMNVGSSTDSELVSIADVLGMILWCKYSMEAQGYPIEKIFCIKTTSTLSYWPRTE